MDDFYITSNLSGVTWEIETIEENTIVAKRLWQREIEYKYLKYNVLLSTIYEFTFDKAILERVKQYDISLPITRVTTTKIFVKDVMVYKIDTVSVDVLNYIKSKEFNIESLDDTLNAI